MSDLLLTGLSGLTAFRTVLDTTSHNIANVATAGYSRQRVELDATTPQIAGAGYVGTGVNATDVNRLYDAFLSAQFRSSQTASAELDTYLGFASQIDGALANENIGLNSALQDFFNAVQVVADDPTSIPARQVMLTEGGVLENRFATLDQLFSDLGTQVRGSLQDNINEINTLSDNIATLNQQIKVALSNANGNVPNDLLDQRDKLIDDLSALVNVKTNEQEDGAVNVFIGNGQSLVLGERHNTLALQPSQFDPSSVDIVFQQPGGNTIVTQFMTGGEIGGTLRFKEEVLDEAVHSLGQIAIGLSFSINAQHANGIDLDGQQGLNFFSTPTLSQIDLVNNGGSLTTNVFDPSTINNSDYEVTTDGGNNYTITRLSDNTVLATGLIAGTTLEQLDGLTFDLTGVSANESYRVISPTRYSAEKFSLALSDPRDIAVALPVVSEQAASNTGTGGLGNMSISGLSAANLPSNVVLSYDDTLKQYTVSNATGGPLAYDSASNSGQSYTVNVAGFGDISFTLTGQPDQGDTISLIDNAGGIGDNRNAHALANIQTSFTLSGGTASFQDVYGQLIADVGRRTQAAEVNSAAQNGLLTQMIASKEAVSGVNLDEEAANLIRFQQAYQAASQVVLTSRTIFDTLLGAFR
ncbi:MAG: flagellar hook-associated protein FlgK [Cycloclasticus sp.]|nr:flagellar hook-associated protein FlgK [Cycloclasticus sp.]MBG97311.1 flagellar hook-associated protein FlgK [Cycloclasticus sp.]HAI97113.1 flagellar hook-associated protein FlgK [Methylococcaceae bacterium]